MTARVPAWAIIIMVCLLLASLALGIANDTGSLPIPAFALNLLSSIAAFSASGLFASALVNRYVRRRYRGVELDRRVAAIARMEALVHDVAQALNVDIEREATSGEGTYSSMPERAVHRLRFAIEARQTEISNATTPEEADGALRMLIIRPGVPGSERPGAVIAAQLSFVSDARLLYVTDRLDVKLTQLEKSFAASSASSNPANYSTALSAGLSAASAIGDVIAWLVAAPGKRMTYQVRNKMRDSETRQEDLPR